MSCKNKAPKDANMWEPGPARDQRWEEFKDYWAEEFNVRMDREPEDHVHRHVHWEEFTKHLDKRDGKYDDEGEPMPTSYFTGLTALNQALHDFMDANREEMAEKEAMGKGVVKGNVSSSTGEYFGMAYFSDLENGKPPSLYGLSDEAFVKMYYEDGCWNVRTAFPDQPNPVK